MSERLNLEQLKAMSNQELYSLWRAWKFPFENMAECGQCLTGHNPAYDWGCTEHKQVAEQMRKFPFDGGYNLHPYLEELYALRLFFDHLYPQPAIEPQTELSKLAKEEFKAREAKKPKFNPDDIGSIS